MRSNTPLGMVGLGRMGANILRRAMRAGIAGAGFDRDAAAVAAPGLRLMASQFATLEPPSPDENALILDVSRPLGALVPVARQALVPVARQALVAQARKSL